MLRNLAASLILYEKITTTEARAKAVRKMVDQAIGLGRRADLSSRRKLLALLPVKNAVAKLIEDLGVRYKNRNSGYSRVMKLPRRKGDAAKMARLELVE